MTNTDESRHTDTNNDASTRIAALKKKRGSIKRQLTIFEKTLDAITVDTDIETLDLENRLTEKHLPLQAEFETCQKELESLTENNETEDLNNERERASFDERFYLIRGRVKILIKRGMQAPPKTISNQNQQPLIIPLHINANNSPFNDGLETELTSNNSSEIDLLHSNDNVTNPEGVGNNQASRYVPRSNLPDLKIPTFSGSLDMWLSFFDSFNAMIHNNPNLTTIEKFQYLKGCVSGDAAKIISSLQTTSENYKVAWDHLKKRYHNKKFIIDNHVKSLFELPSISRDFSIRSLYDSAQMHLRALQALSIDVDKWNALIIHLIKSKLNNYTVERWEDSVCNNEYPSLEQMLNFLERRSHIEETRAAVNLTKNSHKSTILKNQSSTHSQPRNQYSFAGLATSDESDAQSHYTKPTFGKNSCHICKGEHGIFACSKFLSMNLKEKYDTAKKLSICTNCLRGVHHVQNCLSGGCRTCGKKHNTLLHAQTRNPENGFQNNKSKQTSQSNNTEQSNQLTSPTNTPVYNHQLVMPSEVVLATAVVDIVDAKGNLYPCRVMLDSGSQPHVITEKFANKIGLKRVAVDIPLHSIGELSTNIKYTTSTVIKSRYNDAEYDLTLFIVSRIGSTMPTLPINRNSFSLPNELFLADPSFHSPEEVDVILGAQYFYQLLCPGKIPIPHHSAVLQETELGWVVSGCFHKTLAKPNKVYCNFTKFSDLSLLWELDSCKESSKRSKEEQDCESHYKKTTKRDVSGKYVVQLPFKENKAKLGDSYKIAFNRFRSLETKLSKDPTLKTEYNNCLKNYIKEGHMTLLSNEDASKPGVYLSHHAVVKTTSLTTKTRVVFDASCKTSSGVSLNDTLMVGPTLQDDLFSTFTRFRTFRYALTADIEQMYRQVNLNSEDQLFHKILWRENNTDPIKIYTLNTVTFGTACAPFLAIRTLHQLAEDECEKHPYSSSVIKNDFYVDDCLTGEDSISKALALRDDLITLLHKGGFNLRKWNSNDSRLIKNFKNESQDTHMCLDPSDTVKTLGLYWNPSQDSIFYTVNLLAPLNRITKRAIFSRTAQVYDPLGLLGPVIVSAKLMVQSLWKEQLSWDEEVPANLQQNWTDFECQLPLLNQVRFNRYICIPDCVSLQIHGFSDASEKAYGAMLYFCSTDKYGKHHTSLICSKSRVAPMKQISLPKLELCAAFLLANLFTNTHKALKKRVDKVFLWSDSTITLHWINTPSHTLNTFVANRVSEIQTITEPQNWRHVPTNDNPADKLSRGQTPREFLDNTLWQQGPSWLCESENCWPETKIYQGEDPERRKNQKIDLFKLTVSNWDLLKKYSSIRKLQNVVAYCLRFIYNARNKEKTVGPLSQTEIDNSILLIIKLTQSSEFAKEIHSLSQGKGIDRNSKLLSLNPFLENGVLRVGGRLENAKLTENQKHPLVLPKNHHITRLIIREEHIRRMHAGTQATLYGVRETYWPIDGRNVTRQITRQCVVCFRAKPRNFNYVMGNLPENRLFTTRPFLNVGVDYCGPFFIKEKRHRNRNKIKAYVAIYICFASKAVHLELVSDLTTESFIGSLKRFFSRRGKPNTIFSDNAKNFVGASNELKELYENIKKSQNDSIVQNFLLKERVIWRFIPPRAPHFGGLWEASVKSFKHHLLRTVGDKLLTYEQLETYALEIEAILNSRPLTPLSSDPNDLLPLTPGHLLIGSPLTSFPQSDLRDVSTGRLSTWQIVQQMRQHFWSRWQKEYLHQLISRSKWQTATHENNIKVGTLVVLHEDNLPPMSWKLGRIAQLFPGQDKIVRVVSVKTNSGFYKRSLKRLYPLPIHFEHNEQVNK